jgi:hypothetical protein
VDKIRLAACYNGKGNAGFMGNGQTFTSSTDPTGCRGIIYTCQDGEIVERPFNRCLSATTTSRLTLSPLRSGSGGGSREPTDYETARRVSSGYA